jgi:Family of unknown function (DUF5372)
LVVVRNIWGEPRAYYHDAQGRLGSLPAAWTSEAPVDPFVALAGGRSVFHVDDLLRLSVLLRRIAP